MLPPSCNCELTSNCALPTMQCASHYSSRGRSPTVPDVAQRWFQMRWKIRKKNANPIRSWQLKIPPFIIRFISPKKTVHTSFRFLWFCRGFPMVFSHPILEPNTVPPWSPPESCRPMVARRAEQRKSRSFRRCGARGGDGTPEYSPQTGKGKKTMKNTSVLR